MAIMVSGLTNQEHDYPWQMTLRLWRHKRSLRTCYVVLMASWFVTPEAPHALAILWPHLAHFLQPDNYMTGASPNWGEGHTTLHAQKKLVSVLKYPNCNNVEFKLLRFRYFNSKTVAVGCGLEASILGSPCQEGRDQSPGPKHFQIVQNSSMGKWEQRANCGGQGLKQTSSYVPEHASKAKQHYQHYLSLSPSTRYSYQGFKPRIVLYRSSIGSPECSPETLVFLSRLAVVSSPATVWVLL